MAALLPATLPKSKSLANKEEPFRVEFAKSRPYIIAALIFEQILPPYLPQDLIKLIASYCSHELVLLSTSQRPSHRSYPWPLLTLENDHVVLGFFAMDSASDPVYRPTGSSPSPPQSVSPNQAQGPQRNPSPAARGDVIQQVLHASDNDYYEILGVSRNANAKELTKAYREKALECHPDRNENAPGATEAMQKLSRAYDALYEVAKRMKLGGGGSVKDPVDFHVTISRSATNRKCSTHLSKRQPCLTLEASSPFLPMSLEIVREYGAMGSVGSIRSHRVINLDGVRRAVFDRKSRKLRSVNPLIVRLAENTGDSATALCKPITSKTCDRFRLLFKTLAQPGLFEFGCVSSDAASVMDLEEPLSAVAVSCRIAVSYYYDDGLTVNGKPVDLPPSLANLRWDNAWIIEFDFVANVFTVYALSGEKTWVLAAETSMDTQWTSVTPAFTLSEEGGSYVAIMDL